MICEDIFVAIARELDQVALQVTSQIPCANMHANSSK
jgi:hypothetical protein